MNCFDRDGNRYLPVFTDWKEVDLWIEQRGENIAGWVMPTLEVFNFFGKLASYCGVIINPAGVNWAMNKTQITNFLNDHK